MISETLSVLSPPVPEAPRRLRGPGLGNPKPGSFFNADPEMPPGATRRGPWAPAAAPVRLPRPERGRGPFGPAASRRPNAAPPH